MSITQLADALYAGQPREVLYHYTSLRALTEIVKSGCLYATDIQFFSDAAEMKHAADILRIYIAQRIEFQAPNSKLLQPMAKLLPTRKRSEHRLSA